MTMVPLKRGDIVLVDLKGAEGKEKRNKANTGSRPCVVVQNDVGNRFSPLTIVAPLTRATAAKVAKKYPQDVLIPKAELPSNHRLDDSIAECGQLRTIDREKRVHRNLGTVGPVVLVRLSDALKASLGL